MKIKVGAILLVLYLSGCGLFGNGPSAVVSKYLKLSEKSENIEAMQKLFSERASRELGAEKILVDTLLAVDIGTKIASAGESMPFLKPEETINGDFATVKFYTHPTWAAQNDKNNQASALLIKENGEWKLYGFGQSGEPKPKPDVNTFDADSLSKAYLNYPELMNPRLNGKTIMVEGVTKMVGMPREADSSYLFLKTNSYGSSDDYILCKLKSGAQDLFDKAKEIENKKIKVKGIVSAKDSSDPDTYSAVLVLDNCVIQK